MKKTNLSQVLHDIAEQDLPPAHIDLWPGIQEEMKHSARKGAYGEHPMNADKVNLPTRRWARRMAFVAALALIAAAGLLFTTRQGRALGEKLFQFFNTTDQTSYLLPTDQIAPAPATPTPPPTRSVELAEVTQDGAAQTTPGGNIVLAEAGEQAAPQQGEGLSCADPAALSSYLCQIQAAEAQAGFDLKEFPADPKGTVFQQITFNPDSGEARIELQAQGGGSSLTLRQGIGAMRAPGGGADGGAGGGAGGGGEVPAEAVQQMTVNGLYAELVAGGFYIYPNATKAVWEPGGMMTLAWQDGERWFVLEKMGDVYPIEWITPEELVRLAEGLVDDRPLDAAPALDPENLPSPAAAAQLAGFDVPTPRLLPEGYAFKRAVYTYNTVRLFYGPANSDKHALAIFMGRASDHVAGACLDCPPGTVQEVQVNGYPGWFWRGIFHTAAPEPGQPTPASVWQPDASHWVLNWNTDTLWISMAFSPSARSGEVMDMETMVRIGKGMD